MDNLPPSGFQFAGEDYGPVDFPNSLPSEMQAGMTFAGGGPVFPQNQRGGSYGMSPFHMNYSQQASMPSMSSLPASSFRSRFSDYPPDQGPHLPMPLPSSGPGMISDRLPSFSTIVSSSGASSSDIGKGTQALYSSISGQQHAFQSSGSRGHQGQFDSSPYADQVTGKNYSKSPSHGSTSPGMGSNSYIPHSSLLQHSSHNGSSLHMTSHSPRSYKDEAPNQQYLSSAVHLDRHSIYSHGGMSQTESMTIPKFKHKYLSHSQPVPRRQYGPFKFYIVGKTERPSVFNKSTQTNDEQMGELKIKIPKAEIYKSESETEFSDDERRQQIMQNQANHGGTPRGSPRITFPYDPLPAHNVDYRDYNKHSKIKTIISPSFLDAAGKATMTTCVSNKATIVTVGIVSRPSNLGGPEPTDSAHHKAIMSTGNSQVFRSPNKQYSPRLGNDMNSNGDHRIESEEQLIEERKAKARDLEQERMEVSVRIDDTQYVQVGNVKRWQCNECDKSYTTKHNLVMHVLDHSGIKPHLCLKCGKYFKQLSHLNTHMLTHDQIKPHTCNMCGKGFTQISHLKRHTAVSEKNGYCANLRSKHPSGHSPSSSQHEGPMTMHTAPTGVKRFPDQNHSFESEFDTEEMKDGDKCNSMGKLLCRYCDRKFRYPSQLKDHMQSHNGHRPYMCTECGMDFMKEHHLKAHQFTHTGLKPYTCDSCGRSFNQRANLQRHKLIHETTRTFKCNICSKLFTQPQTLKAHQVVHADRKPFECTICGKEFGRYHNLQGHMHMHTNTKPYVCFCGSTFTLKGNLNRHKKVKHGLNETTDVMEEDAVNFLSSLSERARDEHNADGEADSPGSGGESGDGKSGRKGRKSIPRKITHGEEEGAFVQPAQPPPPPLPPPPPPPPSLPTPAPSQQPPPPPQVVSSEMVQRAVPTPVGQKPFVIQNPDTDDEIDEDDEEDDEDDEDEEEEGEIPNPPPVLSSEKILTNERIAPVASVMNFQPLNMTSNQEPESLIKPAHKKPREDVSVEADKRPRRQSQRRSPKIHTSDMEQSDSEENEMEADVNDNTDTDWTPGSRRKVRSKSDTPVPH
ncbi:uncharacterized protein LOC131944880 [Physella acuta]|uniref:uncharacterized protein LOC131944880 n=1 Tax=Physella acuta TaxID=109671 RepID=UPI0027DBB90F|nr:uncharacterized protein LOC131944880 [Physella acuta]